MGFYGRGSTDGGSGLNPLPPPNNHTPLKTNNFLDTKSSWGGRWRGGERKVFNGLVGGGVGVREWWGVMVVVEGDWGS